MLYAFGLTSMRGSLPTIEKTSSANPRMTWPRERLRPPRQRSSTSLATCLIPAPPHLSSGVVVFVHAVTEPRHLALPALHSLDELRDVVHAPNVAQHAQHRLIGSPMQRAVERPSGARQHCVHVHPTAHTGWGQLWLRQKKRAWPHLDARCRAAAAEQFISCSACSVNRMSNTRASLGCGR